MVKKLWTQVISNLENVLAILVSIVAITYGMFYVNQLPLLSAIALALGLIAFGMIKDRNARDELLKQVQQLKDPPSVGSILLDRGKYIPFNDLTASAKKIYLVGPSLVNLFNQWTTYFQYTKLNEHGAILQAIVIDPQSPAVESAASCVNQSHETIINEIETTKQRVRSILESKDGVKNGKIELRTMSTNLNFSMVLIDPDMPNGKIIIEFIGYHAELHNLPHIELTRSRDKEWYQFYLQQYNHIYTDSEICLTS